MDSFFLSKSIEGEAEGAKGCAPHSAQPCMPPSCSCTLPFVCPLCVQSREGVRHRLWVWVRAPVRLPPLRIHGGRGTASVPAQPPVRAPPLRSSQGEGGAWLPSLRTSLVACRPARKAEGGWCRLRVCPSLVRLAPKRGRPRSPSTRPLFARRLCAETQAGGHGFACGPQFARPFCVQPGARRFPFPRGRSFACRPCAQTGGGGGPAAPLLGLGVALARRRRVREGEGGAKGWASRSRTAPFSRPPLSRVPLPGLCVALALSSAQMGCKGGSVHPLPILACTPL